MNLGADRNPQLATLAQFGWVLFQRGDRKRIGAVRTLLRELKPMRLRKANLRPVHSEQAASSTLSKFYGLDRFPPHTDYAHTEEPPHYLIFRSREPRAARTTIYDSLGIPPEMSRRGIFHLSTGRNSFYTRFRQSAGDCTFVRFNSVIMRPVDLAAGVLQQYILEQMDPAIIIDWKINYMAIIDNWRMLHGRGRAVEGNPPLQRLAVWSSK